MAAAPTLRDRLSFLHRLPILLKGTSDDDVPCPGYLFEEIAKISHESLGSSQCLLEYLLNRLYSSSGHVKLKVLKILLYLCGHGSSSFLLILRRNSSFIQEATAALAGPPDPLHGNSLYHKVRAAAQDLGSTLFFDTKLPLPPCQHPETLPHTGMGSQSRPHSTLQGFGYSQEWGRTGSAGEAFLSTIQRAAEVVANVMRPGTESPSAQRPLPRGDIYQPTLTPLASHGQPSTGTPMPGAISGTRAVKHQPGQAGGGWEELDSGPSSQHSSQNSDQHRTSDSGSPSGSDSHLGASRELGDLADRAETSSDCHQELSLVKTVTQGPRAFLSREEVQHFIKECGLLNCEAVLELLIFHLGGTSECAQLVRVERALSAIASLGSADLLPQEHILLLSRPKLQELSMGSPGPVTNKATKILRHFEASCGQLPLAWRPPAEAGPAGILTGPSDLLTDAVPPVGGHVFLQPLSSALLPHGGSAAPHTPDGKAEARLAGSQEQGVQPEQSPGDTDSPEGGPSSRLPSCNSLFAGMELVACPRLVGAGAAAEVSCLVPQAPQTSSQGTAAEELEQSAFAFLNM
ncbi:AP-4 complex accessory subunit tepsin isoform X3 [Nycticebus coucang]|uniref:AP-4 complex accessory subunit tepsin isoform X3 n=1 Tax=Nycticebus coucang TaxID=9470 RepID=UPI00234DED8B|nr:AP-4 complex accessory subunit tepsin isoform X3 [Nycticebus coucang]